MAPSKIRFDGNGYLQPTESIELDIRLFEKYFVQDFPNSTQRKILFKNYLEYIHRFEKEVFPHFEQWIDGSFVSQKENPNDIDVVTFLDYKIFELRGNEIISQFLSFSLEEKFLDAYIVTQYPDNHPNFKLFENQKREWSKRFSSDRTGENLKGFIKIIFPQKNSSHGKQ